jgi:hypothetical protein
LIQGIDPGNVTTASIECIKPKTLFESINRYNLLYNDSMTDHQQDTIKSYAYTYKASMVNDALLLTSYRIRREKRCRNNITDSLSSLQRRRVTRKLRKKKFYNKRCREDRMKIIQHHHLDKASVLTFLGNCSQNCKYVRGHTRRSIKPIIKSLECVEKDKVVTVDEYKSTISCNSCFEVTKKQVVRVGDSGRKRIKGAVTCINTSCPQRLSNRSTTTNRDRNGA